MREAEIRQKEKKQWKRVMGIHLDMFPNNTILLKPGKIPKKVFSTPRLVGAIGSAWDS